MTIKQGNFFVGPYLKRIRHSKSFFYWSIIVLGYIGLYPGRLGYDGGLALKYLDEGRSTDIWTAQYFITLKFLTINGLTLALASLFGLLVLAFSFKFWLSSIEVMLNRNSSKLLQLSLLPIIIFFGLTVSHDSFLASGLLLIAAQELRRSSKSFSNRKRTLIDILASFSLSLSYLGLAILILYLGVLAFQKNLLRLALTLVLTFSFATLGAVFVNHQPTPPRYLFPLVADLKCVAQSPSSQLNETDIAFLKSLRDISEWKKLIACDNTDPVNSYLDNVRSGKVTITKFLKGYLAIANRNPAIVLGSHFLKSREAIPFPFSGLPNSAVEFPKNGILGQQTDKSLISGPDFLHVSIDSPEYLQKISILKPVEATLLLIAFIYNASSNFWGWGGFWFWFVLLVGILARRKYQNFNFFIFVAPTLLLHTLLIYLGPISAPRYVLSTILMGLSFAFLILQKSIYTASSISKIES